MKPLLLLISLLVTALMIADHQALLGSHMDSELDYFDVYYTAQDQQSGAIITDVFVNCSRRGSSKACSLEAGENKQIRRLKFAVIRRIKKGYLFTHSEQLVGADELELQLMFIHPNYQRLSQHYSLQQLLQQRDQLITVELIPL